MLSLIKTGAVRILAVRIPAVRKLFRLLANETGVTGVTFALLFVPMILIVGGAFDYARMIQFQSSLQSAVDEAALAGAAAFTDSTQSSSAVQVATRYFNHAILPTSISVNAPSVTANAGGSINPALGNAAAYTVTVSATAKVGTTLLSLVIPSATLSATATAADPLVTPQLSYTRVNSQACDGNTLYLYLVPKNANGTGYDFGAVPPFSVANGVTQGNYYEIGTSYGPSSPLGQMPPRQVLPTFSVNQPLGVMLRNDTNGNPGNPNCGTPVTGANSYGAPNQSSQAFYSSLLLNGQSPSQNSNYAYTVTVTSTANWFGGSTITSVITRLPPSALYPAGATINQPIAPPPYNTLATYLGINAPGSGHSNCSATPTQSWGPSSTTTYSCTTQYLSSASSSEPNCSLYVQTGVTQSYLNGLSSTSTAPAAALTQCFAPGGGGSQYAAPSCSQLSAQATQAGVSSGTAPAVVFWWDDAGGVGPGEQYYSPASHCSATSANGPGYGEDCQYRNSFFGAECAISGGSGSGFSEVVLSQ
jgi:Flp pilus assembly protein TadG